ncbi:hypothetical protein [Streptomyces sp. NPDC096032]|uniref:hypothetical protein n=1 Tax=Streptomyces sp. NPDC096032 TaxID=3366070 RepID=UPI0037FFE5DE
MPAGHPPKDAAQARRGGPAPAVSGGGDDALDGEAPGRVPPRTARALWWGSAGLVLAVLGTSVLVAGAGDGRRPAVAGALVLAQAFALRWQTRAPVAVLAAGAVTGLAVWALLPAVTLTGALLAAQITLCVLSATGPRRLSAWALAAMCLPAPLAFTAGGPTGLAVYLLTVVLAAALHGDGPVQDIPLADAALLALAAAGGVRSVVSRRDRKTFRARIDAGTARLAALAPGLEKTVRALPTTMIAAQGGMGGS